MQPRPRILVTRSSRQASELAQRLRSLDLDPVLLPVIEIAEPTSFRALDAALASLISPGAPPAFHWLLFTSANAVDAFSRRRDHATGVHAALPASLQIAAIGAATARALGEIGLAAFLVPAQAVAESLAEALLPHALQADGTPTRFLLVRAEEAREHLPQALRAAGAEVTIAPAYRTVIPEASVAVLQELFDERPETPASRMPASRMPASVTGRLLAPPSVHAITFTSSSTVRNLLGLCEAAGVTLPEAALRISIGPITTGTLRDFGLPPHAESPEATVTALAETVARTLQARSAR